MKKKMILNTIQRDFINPDGIDKHYDNLTYIIGVLLKSAVFLRRQHIRLI